MVFSIDSTKTSDGQLSFEGMERKMTEPYEKVVGTFESLTLSTASDLYKEKMLPTAQIREKLDSLGVKTVGGFYAACGFEKLVVRNQSSGEVLKEIVFTSESSKAK